MAKATIKPKRKIGKPKGSPKSGGRRKGVSNVITRELREMVLEALSGVGGVKYLVKQAEENPGIYCRLLARCMPQAIEVRSETLATVTLDFSGAACNAGSVDSIDETPIAKQLLI